MQTMVSFLSNIASSFISSVKCIKYGIMIAIPINLLSAIFQKYIYSDFEFLIFLSILVLADTLLSILYHFINKSISSSGFSKFVIKLIAYCVLLILVHVLTNFTINGDKQEIFEWSDSVIYISLIIRESISIVEKLEMLKPGIVPPFITKRLKKFDDETGNYIGN